MLNGDLQGAQDEAILRAHENTPPPPELEARITVLLEKSRAEKARGLFPAGGMAEFVELLDNKRRALRRELREVEDRITEVLDEIDRCEAMGPIVGAVCGGRRIRHGSGKP